MNRRRDAGLQVCAFCRATYHGQDPNGADVNDAAAWAAIQRLHTRSCAWATSRGFRAPSLSAPGAKR